VAPLPWLRPSGWLISRSGVDVADVYAGTIGELAADGLLSLDGTRLAATPSGLRVLDRVTAALLSAAPAAAG